MGRLLKEELRRYNVASKSRYANANVKSYKRTQATPGQPLKETKKPLNRSVGFPTSDSSRRKVSLNGEQTLATFRKCLQLHPHGQ